jgi:hypothetical protein
VIDNPMHKILIDAANEAGWDEESMMLAATRFLTILGAEDETVEQRFLDYLQEQMAGEVG